jgi:hypothetical protein
MTLGLRFNRLGEYRRRMKILTVLSLFFLEGSSTLCNNYSTPSVSLSRNILARSLRIGLIVFSPCLVSPQSIGDLCNCGEFRPISVGVWTGDVYFGLLWVQQGEANPIKQGTQRKKIGRIEGIPSWSWASLLAEISWNHLYPHRKKLAPACRVISVAQTSGEEKVEEWMLPSTKDKISLPANVGTSEFPLDRVVNQLTI